MICTDLVCGYLILLWQQGNECVCAPSCLRVRGLFLHLFQRHKKTWCHLHMTTTQSHVNSDTHMHTHNPKKSESKGFRPFNLFGTLVWDQNRWQLQHGCSASLGCVGAVVSGRHLLTCCNLHCLKHCGELSRKLIVDLMRSHGESWIFIICPTVISYMWSAWRGDKTSCSLTFLLTEYLWVKQAMWSHQSSIKD